MKKFYKFMSMLMIFIITVVTASGCANAASTSDEKPTSYITTIPSVMTYRSMDQNLYLGYLGAQRDFILLVDNFTYNNDNPSIDCGEGKPGCAATLTKMIISYGIKAAAINGQAGSENVLIYYTSSGDFDKFGSSDWYKYLTGDNKGYGDFVTDDYVLMNTCGTGTARAKGTSICQYSKDLTEKGYSNAIGNAMIIIFHNGEVADVIGDKQLDPLGKLNVGGSINRSPYDELDTDKLPSGADRTYYNEIVKSLKKRIRLSTSTNSKATSSGKKIEMNELTTLNDLYNLTSGASGVKDYLLLITSSGFIEDKIGTQSYFDSNNNSTSESPYAAGDEDSEFTKSLTLLLNSVTTYVDNCALADDALANFLKDFLSDLLMGAVGAGVGALIGTAIFPGIGTAVGAIVGFFAGLFINMATRATLKKHNGIMESNYCNIVAATLDNIESNVPVYSYNIGKAKDHVQWYNNNDSQMDPVLRSYYDRNKDMCARQHYKVAVPSGILSFLTDALNEEYAYSDACEKAIVSSYVGGFGGSPSLLLFLDGKKVDDLYGRVTANLVAEMMITWGLQSIGDLYTIAYNRRYNDMSFVLGSAQPIESARYCISEDSMPICSDNYSDLNHAMTLPLNGTYVKALQTADGIQIPVTNLYKEYSTNKTRADNIKTVTSMYKLDANKFNPQLTLVEYYKRDVITGHTWTRLEGDPDLLAADLIGVGDVKGEILNSIEDNRTSLYQVTYNGINYILCGNGDVVGYVKENDKYVIKYYYISSRSAEYIFDSNFKGYDGYFTTENKNLVNVEATYPFYVHIEYKVNDSDGNLVDATYTYAL